jgi:hypothetical protein
MIYVITEITGKRENKVARLVGATTNLQVAEAHKATLEAAEANLSTVAVQVKASFDAWTQQNPAPERPTDKPKGPKGPKGGKSQTVEQKKAEERQEREARVNAKKSWIQAHATWAKQAQTHVAATCTQLGIEVLTWNKLSGQALRLDKKRYKIETLPELT